LHCGDALLREAVLKAEVCQVCGNHLHSRRGVRICKELVGLIIVTIIAWT
jgi:hypothetical protein